ncbi:MAG: APC family permease [Chloroflexi bacterium]|nr:APC family permease [Chloroflexota bacterium]
MADIWQPKPGDRVFRPRRIKHFRLKRVLGVPGLFSIGYGDVGSSIYYALGVVALVAFGATPIALGIAGVVYIFNALTYAEGSAMLTSGGGSASYARLGFNNLVGFISGWALMLSYIVTMAISAYTIPPYLAFFWPVLREPAASTIFSMGVIVFLMLINVLGIKESSRLNMLFITIDILTQVVLVVLGILLILRPNPDVLAQNMFGIGNWPSTQNLILGIALAALCFTGVESVSQHGEETRQPEKRMPQAYILMIVVVLVLFAGISLVALSAMTPQVLADPINGWARDPVAGIADAVSRAISPEEIAASVSSEEAVVIVITWLLDWFRDILPVMVALLASSILLIATNAGLLGISRLAYNLSTQNQLPATLSRVHHRFRTPYIPIILFCIVTMVLLIPGFFNPDFFVDLGSLYVFGSLLTFALAHAAILALRIRQPDLPRPFKLGFNIIVKKRELPLTAILGFLATTAIWIVIITIEPNSRWTGLAWMGIGLILYYIYYLYRRSRRLPLTHPESEPTKHE